jgi:hypothetical protein
MAVLEGALPGTKFTPPPAQADGADKGATPGPHSRPRDGGDDSGRAHRQLIGSIGLLLPILLPLIAALRPNDPAHRWELLGSISAYYYTGAAAAFVGLLVALALYLFAYQGFRNKYQEMDKGFAKLAAAAAIGVAFFPASPPDGLKPPWWTTKMVMAHYGSAAVLFSVFAVFCLWLFRLTDPQRRRDPDKTWRNNVYLGCGIAIVTGMVWAVIVGVINKGPIFAPESLMLGAFAISWLVKGSIHKTIAEAVKKKI